MGDNENLCIMEPHVSLKKIPICWGGGGLEPTAAKLPGLLVKNLTWTLKKNYSNCPKNGKVWF